MTTSTLSRVVVPGGICGRTASAAGQIDHPPRGVPSALAQGTSRITHPLAADDCERSAEAFRALGISIESDARGQWVVVGGTVFMDCGSRSPITSIAATPGPPCA